MRAVGEGSGWPAKQGKECARYRHAAMPSKHSPFRSTLRCSRPPLAPRSHVSATYVSGCLLALHHILGAVADGQELVILGAPELGVDAVADAHELVRVRPDDWIAAHLGVPAEVKEGGVSGNERGGCEGSEDALKPNWTESGFPPKGPKEAETRQQHSERRHPKRGAGSRALCLAS